MIQEYLLIMRGLFEMTEPYFEGVEEANNRIFYCKSQANDKRKLILYLKEKIRDLRQKQDEKIRESKKNQIDVRDNENLTFTQRFFPTTRVIH